MATLPDSQRLVRTRMLLDDLISHVENERNKRHLAVSGSTKALGVFKAPATVFPVLPLEILDYICQQLTFSDLTIVVQANSTLNLVGTRRLYHSIGADMDSTRMLQCMISLDRNPELPLLVKSFEVNLIKEFLTKSFYLLLERTLRKMVNLTALVIELPKRHSPTWILPITPSSSSTPLPARIFRLRSLTTSMHCKPPLARFLDSQPEITELTLRGINSDASNPLFPFMTTLFHPNGIIPPDSPFAMSSNLTQAPSQFTLLPTSLSKLTHFNAIHAGPAVIRDIIKSRPVTHMSIPLFAPHTMETLSALSSASKPLTRLSVMSFDPLAPSFLIEELAARFPDLEALHIVVLMAEVTAGMLLDWGKFLVGFKKLKYITFMAALGNDNDTHGDESREEINEKKIAKVWHASCSTLKTIILPQGKVWFEGTREDETVNEEGNWRCLSSDGE
ncbi:hypothetical protein AGABI1DRAFT_108830 [Agaricus bisporus var. burnettii JB137-S8]|uniref:F-box domain-containing protein n=1 Tax=Agaricus bisporus var. burnettii (strain JB137-S8 / ATCC MYA-4627 / FGSC 10392) TaxID=597362 RepID=K5X061_AGABU|nr:uncharacterized protein AGABI1DRAFT_108830 [Agaricus bisporus var. burnettii JB137-S8]EKM76262.1 hypothetical protein AGABI1DRAFT_108830 [Agaricus bisporus var. burnettii JB137-S8]